MRVVALTLVALAGLLLVPLAAIGHLLDDLVAPFQAASPGATGRAPATPPIRHM